MPLPSPRRFTFTNKVGPYPPTEQTVSYGRTVWNGNQRRRRTGKIGPPTAMTSQIIKCNLKSYDDGWRSGSALFVAGNTYSTENSSLGSLSSARIAAISKFSGNSGFAETLAETPSALRLIARRAHTIYQILHLAGKGSFRAAGAILKSATGYNVSNRSVKRLQRKFGEGSAYDSRRASAFWLELQFGFLPLFQSVYDSLEVFRSSYDVRRATGRNEGTKFGIYAGVGSQGVETLDKLGITNPALLAWNLIPFSFVIDWFLPIGTALKWIGSNRAVGPRFAWSSTTQVATRTTRLGEFWQSVTTYSRKPEPVPGIREIFSADARSHGLWTAVTAVSLFNALR